MVLMKFFLFLQGTPSSPPPSPTQTSLAFPPKPSSPSPSPSSASLFDPDPDLSSQNHEMASSGVSFTCSPHFSSTPLLKHGVMEVRDSASNTDISVCYNADDVTIHGCLQHDQDSADGNANLVSSVFLYLGVRLCNVKQDCKSNNHYNTSSIL